MASYVPPKKNTAFVCYVSLEDQANPGMFKASPTLAAGDVLVATDDGAPGNIATLPTVDADFTKRLKMSLSAGEMNGDNVTVLFSDAAGAEWYDLTLNIQTSARQIDDLATPTNITAGTLTTVTNLTNAPTVGDLTETMKNSVFDQAESAVLALLTDGITTLADGAITATKFDGSTAFPVTSADTGSTRIARTGADGDTLETLSDQIDAIDASGTAAAVWTYVTRTLTALPAATTDGTAAGSIARRRGDSWSISLTIGAITGYTSLWFTAKWDRMDTDAQAVIQIKKNDSALDDGLLYVNGAAAIDAAMASITVSDATTGAIIIAVDETITDDLPPTGAYYDVQVLNAGTVTTPESGTLTISADVTRAVA